MVVSAGTVKRICCILGFLLIFSQTGTAVADVCYTDESLFSARSVFINHIYSSAAEGYIPGPVAPLARNLNDSEGYWVCALKCVHGYDSLNPLLQVWYRNDGSYTLIQELEYSDNSLGVFTPAIMELEHLDIDDSRFVYTIANNGMCNLTLTIFRINSDKTLSIFTDDNIKGLDLWRLPSAVNDGVVFISLNDSYFGSGEWHYIINLHLVHSNGLLSELNIPDDQLFSDEILGEFRSGEDSLKISYINYIMTTDENWLDSLYSRPVYDGTTRLNADGTPYYLRYFDQVDDSRGWFDNCVN